MSPPPGQGAVFLERAGYRQRRLRDGLRMLPLLGLLLWFVPVIWPEGEATGAPDTAAQGGAGPTIYLFTVWLLLIALSAMLNARLRPEGDDLAPRDTP